MFLFAEKPSGSVFASKPAIAAAPTTNVWEERKRKQLTQVGGNAC